MKRMLKDFWIAWKMVLALAVILCGLYPLIVWGAAQGLFPSKAGGSLVIRRGKVVGSALIGWDFIDPEYFHPRPSAAGRGYDAAASGGSNLGPLSKKLSEDIKRRVADYRQENRLSSDTPVPADAVTASGSGLDPHISLKNAVFQIRRVAAYRGLREEAVLRLVKKHMKGRDLGFLGEPRINVLLLNLDLDDLGR